MTRTIQMEALWLARDELKELIRNNGGRPSSVAPKELTGMAKEVLRRDPAKYYTKAERICKLREEGKL